MVTDVAFWLDQVNVELSPVLIVPGLAISQNGIARDGLDGRLNTNWTSGRHVPLGVVGEGSGEFREAFGDGAVVTVGVGAAIGLFEEATEDATEDAPLTAGATGTLGGEATGTETPAAA